MDDESGPRYKVARERAGLSLGQAAKILKLDESGLLAIEALPEVSPQHAKLAKLYRVTPCWLSGHTTNLSDGLIKMLGDHAGTGCRSAAHDAREVAFVASGWATCDKCAAPVVRTDTIWNGCNNCHGAVWTAGNGVRTCRGYFTMDRILANDTAGPPNEAPCGQSQREPRPAGRPPVVP